jgi:hypothetical protein
MGLIPVNGAPGYVRQKTDWTGRNIQGAQVAGGTLAAAGGLAATMGSTGALAAAGPYAAAGVAALAAYDYLREKPKATVQEAQTKLPYSESTMSSRLDSIQQNPVDTLMAARNSISAMNLDRESRLYYQKPIDQAIAQYQQNYGVRTV